MLPCKKKSFSTLLLIHTSGYLSYLSKTMHQHIRSQYSRASAPWNTPVHQSWHVASQQSWPKSGRLLHLGHDAGACVSSTNPWYGRVAAAVCWDMGWILAEHSLRCNWSLVKKTGSMCPYRRWSLSLNTCYDVACLTFKLPYITTGSFLSH